MTDYHPLLARAVAALEKNTGEARRGLYERARNALVTQLRSLDPPLTESEITRERLGLEEAIRRIESDAARGLYAKATTPLAAPPTPTPPKAPAPTVPPPAPPSPPAPLPEPPQAAEPAPPPAPPPTLIKPPAAKAPAAEPPPPARLPDPEPARETVTEGAPDPAPDDDIAAAPPRRPQDNGSRPASPRRIDPRRASEDITIPRSRAPLVMSLLALLLLGVIGAAGWVNRDKIKALISGQPTTVATPTPGPATPPRPDQPKSVDRVPQEGVDTTAPPPGVTSQPTSPQPPAPGAPEQAAPPPDATLPQPSAPNPQATAPTAPTQPPAPAVPPPTATPAPPAAGIVSQKVTLFEETPGAEQGGREFAGTVNWRLETISPGQGAPPEPAVKADIDIPEKKMTVQLTFRRNVDQTLPASHTIEVLFNLPADFAYGGIANVPGILLKSGDAGRGQPLSAISVRITNGFFLVGLSAVDIDRQRNTQLLKERDAIIIPLLYNNGRRGILTVDKGTPGAQILNEAFAAWGQ